MYRVKVLVSGCLKEVYSFSVQEKGESKGVLITDQLAALELMKHMSESRLAGYQSTEIFLFRGNERISKDIH